MRRKVSNAKQSKLWQNEHRVTDQRNTRTHKVAAKEHKVHILADKENIHPNVQRNESANDDFEKSKNEFFALKVQKQRKTNQKSSLCLAALRMSESAMAENEGNCDCAVRNHRFAMRSPLPLHNPKANTNKSACKRCDAIALQCALFDKTILNFQIDEGLSSQNYLHILKDRIRILQEIEENLNECERSYAEMAVLQTHKLRTYYKDILTIVEKSLEHSEQLLAAAISCTEKTFVAKKNEIHQEIHFTLAQIGKLLRVSATQIEQPNDRFERNKVSEFWLPEYETQTNETFDVERTLKNEVKITVPIFSVFANFSDFSNKQSTFQSVFDESFAVKPLFPEQFEFLRTSKETRRITNTDEKPKQNDFTQSQNPKCKGKEKQMEKLKENMNENQKHSSESSPFKKLFLHETTNLGETENQSTNKTNGKVAESADDFFCDESLQKGIEKRTLSSFSSAPRQSGFANDCIVELIDEQDAVSPVYKAI